MADIVNRKTRSRMMSGIRGKNTKPEITVRKALFRRGFRYALHRKDLPGKPDLVLPKYRTVIFVNGCFWHVHHCRLFKWPRSNTEFWREKLGKNVKRDRRNYGLLRQRGWKVLIIWECAIKGQPAEEIERCIDAMAVWLQRQQASSSPALSSTDFSE